MNVYDELGEMLCKRVVATIMPFITAIEENHDKPQDSYS
jgi:hypothetical protein